MFDGKKLRDEEWFFWACTAFFLSLVISASGCASDPYRAVAQIHVNDGLWGVEGSATLIHTNGPQGIAITARHVAIKSGNLVTLSWLNAGGQKTQGFVIEVLEGDGFETDQALILCEMPNGVDPVPVGEFDPAGGPLISVGWRDGNFYETIAYDAIEDNGVIRSNQPFIGGMSGGASFQDGKLIGVAVGSNRKDTAVTSNGEHLKKLINSIPQ